MGSVGEASRFNYLKRLKGSLNLKYSIETGKDMIEKISSFKIHFRKLLC